MSGHVARNSNVRSVQALWRSMGSHVVMQPLLEVIKLPWKIANVDQEECKSIVLQKVS